MLPLERQQPNASRSVRKLLGAFSIGNNLARLTSPNCGGPANGSRRRSPPALGQLDLLRSLSSIWIIVSHSYFFALAWLDFEPKSTSGVYETAFGQFLPGATFAVDSFFVLSGLLAGHKRQQRLRNLRTLAATDLGRRQLERTNLSRALADILLRYLRLAPVLMSLTATGVLLLPNLCPAHGPETPAAQCPNLAKASAMFAAWCQSQWWLNLLMVQNLVGTQRMCMSHSWFVAVEFQLFALCTLAIWLANKWRAVKQVAAGFSWPCSAALIVIAQLANSLLVYLYDLPPMPMMPANAMDKQLVQENEFYRLLYIKPHHWLSSYLVGAALANCSSGARRTLSTWTAQRRRLLAVVNLCTLLALILSMWPYRWRQRAMSKQYAAVYIFLARPIWALSVASLLMLSSRLKVNKTFARLLAALSRLTYSAYLLHPILMAAFYGTRRELFHFSHSLLLYFALGHLVLAHLFALVVYLLIELPIKTILADLTDRRRRRDDNETMSLSNRQLAR